MHGLRLISNALSLFIDIPATISKRQSPQSKGYIGNQGNSSTCTTNTEGKKTTLFAIYALKNEYQNDRI